MQAWGTQSQEKRVRGPFSPPLALPTHPQRPSLPTWRVPVGAGFQLLGQTGPAKGAGPGGRQAVASSEVGALQAPETEKEKVEGGFGRVCHVGPPHAVVLGNTSLLGAAAGRLCLQINLSPRDATGLGALRHRGASCNGHYRHSPGWGKRLCPSLPQLLPSNASPPGQQAEGRWGDWVGQPAQPEQRDGQWL